MKKILLPFFVFLFVAAIFPAIDPAIPGKWRSPKPIKPGDDSLLFDYEFLNNGHMRMNTIDYKWNSQNQNFDPVNASMIAGGDNDKWETENGFLSFNIKEKALSWSNFYFRYRIFSDTMKMWIGDVYHGKSAKLEGEWTKVEVDPEDPEEKTITRLTLNSGGGGWMQVNDKIDSLKWSVDENFLWLISRLGTQSWVYEVYPKMLGLYDPDQSAIIVKRK